MHWRSHGQELMKPIEHDARYTSLDSLPVAAAWYQCGDTQREPCMLIHVPPTMPSCFSPTGKLFQDAPVVTPRWSQRRNVQILDDAPCCSRVLPRVCWSTKPDWSGLPARNAGRKMTNNKVSQRVALSGCGVRGEGEEPQEFQASSMQDSMLTYRI